MTCTYTKGSDPTQRRAREIGRSKNFSADFTPPQKSYRAYHADLMARLEGEVGLMFLLHAILHFRADHQPLRTFWERYWNEDKRTPDDLRTEYDIDYNYWDRAWNMRNKAGRIIQGVEPWPRAFLPWKGMQELRYHHGRRTRPPWLDYEDDDDAFADDVRTAAWSRPKRKRKAA